MLHNASYCTALGFTPSNPFYDKAGAVIECSSLNLSRTVSHCQSRFCVFGWTWTVGFWPLLPLLPRFDKALPLNSHLGFLGCGDGWCLEADWCRCDVRRSWSMAFPRPSGLSLCAAARGCRFGWIARLDRERRGAGWSCGWPATLSSVVFSISILYYIYINMYIYIHLYVIYIYDMIYYCNTQLIYIYHR